MFRVLSVPIMNEGSFLLLQVSVLVELYMETKQQRNKEIFSHYKKYESSFKFTS